jgi:transposase
VRDLLRKRSQLVHHKTAHLLSIQNLYSRNTGSTISANRIKQLSSEKVDALFTNCDLALAVKANFTVMRSLETEIAILERIVKERVKLKPAYRYLLTVSGIGQIRALTIMLETGDIRRFSKVGNFASYCRCVKSEKLSNGKRKGSGNTKNGNKYLSWAFVEAANFAIRFEPLIARFYQRKKAKTHRVVAIKAVAHKLARGCYYIMRDEVPFDVDRAFA